MNRWRLLALAHGVLAVVSAIVLGLGVAVFAAPEAMLADDPGGLLTVKVHEPSDGYELLTDGVPDILVSVQGRNLDQNQTCRTNELGFCQLNLDAAVGTVSVFLQSGTVIHDYLIAPGHEGRLALFPNGQVDEARLQELEGAWQIVLFGVTAFASALCAWLLWKGEHGSAWLPAIALVVAGAFTNLGAFALGVVTAGALFWAKPKPSVSPPDDDE